MRVHDLDAAAAKAAGAGGVGGSQDAVARAHPAGAPLRARKAALALAAQGFACGVRARLALDAVQVGPGGVVLTRVVLVLALWACRRPPSVAEGRVVVVGCVRGRWRGDEVDAGGSGPVEGDGRTRGGGGMEGESGVGDVEGARVLGKRGGHGS
eukprot:scaffold61250_cov65-Phaeocystis_antarctica.AAC.4